jgi:hypothetical protein
MTSLTSFLLSLYLSEEVQILLATKGFHQLFADLLDTLDEQWISPFYGQPRWAFITFDRILCRLHVGTFIVFSVVLGL